MSAFDNMPSEVKEMLDQELDKLMDSDREMFNTMIVLVNGPEGIQAGRDERTLWGSLTRAFAMLAEKDGGMQVASMLAVAVLDEARRRRESL